MTEALKAKKKHACRLAASRYKQVFAYKRRFFTRTFTAWIARDANADRRVGVIASKRSLGLAVERNRAKRLLRTAFRLRRDFLASDVDLILSARAGIKGRALDAVIQDLEFLFKKAAIGTLRTGADSPPRPQASDEKRAKNI